MSAASILMAAGSNFTENSTTTLFKVNETVDTPLISETVQIPFDNTVLFGATCTGTIPYKGDLINRITLKTELPAVYTPATGSYVYPLYSDQVDGRVFSSYSSAFPSIQPADTTGYFTTPFLNAWATNSTNYEVSVAFDPVLRKFVFTSANYQYIYFPNEQSASFWGFDIVNYDIIINGGYGYKLTGGSRAAQLNVIQAGWVPGASPPPPNYGYVDSVSQMMIKRADLLIGGQRVDSITGERLVIEDDIGAVSYQNQAGLTIMTGKNDSSTPFVPRTYYTKLSFNIDHIPVSATYRQDIQVQVEFDTLDNITRETPSSGFNDSKSYLVSNLIALSNSTMHICNNSVLPYKNFLIFNGYPSSGYPYNTMIYNTLDNSISSRNVSGLENVGGLRCQSSGYIYFNKETVDDCSIQRYNITSVFSNNSPSVVTSTYKFWSIAPPDNAYCRISYKGILADARYVYAFLPNFNYFKIPGASTYCTWTNVQTIDNFNMDTYITFGSPVAITPESNIAYLTFANNPNYHNYGIAVTSYNENVFGTFSTAVGSYLQYTSILTTGGSNITSVTFTFSSSPGAFVDQQVWNGTVLNFITGYIRVIAVSGNTITVEFPRQTVSNIPSNTWMDFRNGAGIRKQTTTQLIISTKYDTSQASYAKSYYYGAFGNSVWVRYDTTGDFNTASSYQTPNTLAAGCSVKDMHSFTDLMYRDLRFNDFNFQYDSGNVTFDGRYIYYYLKSITKTVQYLCKIDTQNFFSKSGHTHVDISTLNPVPNIDTRGGPFVSDGRYLYVSGTRSTNVFSRFDSTKSISLQTSWEYVTVSTGVSNGGAGGFYPAGFDDRYVYYYDYLRDIKARIIIYDTTKPFSSPSSWSWLFFRSNIESPETVLTSAGSKFHLDFDMYYQDNSVNYNATEYFVKVIPGPRYTHICFYYPNVYVFGGDKVPTKNIIRIDTSILNSLGPVSSSLIVNYHKIAKPPKSFKQLIGQTDLNEFVMKAGKSSDIFTLRFVNPVREFWVVVQSPGRVKRLTLRLNDTILVDDDQTMTNTLRSFESHSQMPTSNVCVYSFAVDPEKLQPSGTLNMSRIAFPTLELGLVSQAATDLYVRVYAKTFNVLQCQNGLGGLLFNSAL
jgi:hypothetical protein